MMKRQPKNKTDSRGMNEFRAVSRRDFMKTTALGGGALLLIGNLGILRVVESRAGEAPASFMIVVDYSKCTGCRTCETACSAYNQKRTVNREILNGLGNPYFSNIRVYGYNPDVDIPSVCAMCPDSPCIEACPVEPDQKTGRRALYRDDKTSTIKNDLERCIGCGSCAGKCRVGVIIPNPETNKPERMCTLCDGDPQCVKYCPYGALSHVRVDIGREFFGLKPDQIAADLIKEWYKRDTVNL